MIAACNKTSFFWYIQPLNYSACVFFDYLVWFYPSKPFHKRTVLPQLLNAPHTKAIPSTELGVSLEIRSKGVGFTHFKSCLMGCHALYGDLHRLGAHPFYVILFQSTCCHNLFDLCLQHADALNANLFNKIQTDKRLVRSINEIYPTVATCA